MKRAGLNIIREFQLLPEDEIEKLSYLSKLDCDIAVGKMQIKNKDFSKKLEQAFTDVMNHFLDMNHIDRDVEVISIKKDACFVLNKDITVSSFGKHLKFIPKNQYHAYIYLTPLEFYFKKDDIDVKGLLSDKKERDRVLRFHKHGILNFLEFVVDLAEKTNQDQIEMTRFFHEFVSLYKNRELEFDYYREFNTISKFRYQFAGAEVLTENIDDSMLDKINIEYNYTHIILPLINLLL